MTTNIFGRNGTQATMLYVMSSTEEHIGTLNLSFSFYGVFILSEVWVLWPHYKNSNYTILKVKGKGFP